MTAIKSLRYVAAVVGSVFFCLVSTVKAQDVTGTRLNIGTNNTLSGALLCTIAGGQNNTISNTYPSGSFCVIGGGQHNTITSINCTIAGGVNNSISGNEGFIGGGFFNIVSGIEATVGGGLGNNAAGFGSVIPGGYYGSAPLSGQLSHAAGKFAVAGDAQEASYILRAVSTSATQELFLDGSSALLTLPTNSARAFEITIVVQNSNGDSAAFKSNGLIKNVGGVTALAGGTVSLIPYAADTVPSAYTVTLQADTVNNALAIIANSDTSTNRWVATVKSTEVQQ